jgi:asparagine synthase (glutamine-hydrolysing)
MCGIAGLWTRTGCSDEELRRTVERMTATLVHRGPDDAGVWLDAASGAGLGFRRLSILDLTPSGHQPMESHDGRFVIAFNGEIYNFADLKTELIRAGEVFRGSSDTEVILGAASRWGAEAAIPRLWGMFAIALWDRAERRLLLARDRFGKKPLYYALHDRTVSFASELKALRAVWPGLSVDRDAVASYLRFGYVPAPSTIYSGVWKLPPGTIATVDGAGTFSVRSYWDGRAVAEAGLSSRTGRPDEREAARELDRLLRDAVTRRIVADVPVGAFLSGGVDSSLVVALMQAVASRPVRTFTLGFTDPDFDEAPAARAIAAHLGTDHTEFYVSPADARNVIPSLPDTYDEPFGDASQIPTALVASLARQHVTVALTGDGGDEVFGGYVRHLWADRVWDAVGRWPAGLRRAAGSFLAIARPSAVDRLYRLLERGVPSRWRQVHAGEKLAKLATMLQAGSDDHAYELLVSAWPEGGIAIGAEAGGAAPLGAGGLPAAATFVERMMLQDQMRYLPDDILVKVDRATMAASLEARAPLLDHRLAEWVWRLPVDFRCRAGVGKWLLRQVLANYAPAALFDRPKTGFGIPVGAWLRGPLRPWAESLLDEGRLAREGFLRPADIRSVWAEHLAGRRDHSSRLWVVLMFQAWLERWAR